MSERSADLTFEARGLTKVHRTAAGEVRALRGVDLDIRQGETLVLLGPSGSGKSTLLNILGGLDRPTDGRMVFHGRDLARASDQDLTEYRRRSVGFIFQFFNLSPSLTARENVELANGVPPRPAAIAPEIASDTGERTETAENFRGGPEKSRSGPRALNLPRRRNLAAVEAAKSHAWHMYCVERTWRAWSLQRARNGTDKP